MISKIPDGVRELLTHRIDSFEKLDIILALCKLDRRSSSIDHLATSLGLTPETVRDAAREMRSVSLIAVSSSGELQLLPPSSRDHAAVEELARIYEDDSFTVIKAMGEIAMGRIRNMAAGIFADAFLIRKKPPKGGNRG